MPRVYAQPPLVEALAEFQFVSSDAWDWTVPGLLYGRIKRSFPTKRALPTVQLQVRTAPDAEPEEVRQGIARMQFLTAHERRRGVTKPTMRS